MTSRSSNLPPETPKMAKTSRIKNEATVADDFQRLENEFKNLQLKMESDEKMHENHEIEMTARFKEIHAKIEDLKSQNEYLQERLAKKAEARAAYEKYRRCLSQNIERSNQKLKQVNDEIADLIEMERKLKEDISHITNSSRATGSGSCKKYTKAGRRITGYTRAATGYTRAGRRITDSREPGGGSQIHRYGGDVSQEFPETSEIRNNLVSACGKSDDSTRSRNST